MLGLIIISKRPKKEMEKGLSAYPVCQPLNNSKIMCSLCLDRAQSNTLALSLKLLCQISGAASNATANIHYLLGFFCRIIFSQEKRQILIVLKKN